jgi:hypothetical protein
MLSREEMARIREEREVMENWRASSRHVIAEMLEACAVCGTVREKERLTRCRWCQDVFYCQEGVCSQQHRAEMHPGRSLSGPGRAHWEPAVAR